MSLDLPGAIALSVSASVIVAALTAALPWAAERRLRAAAVLAAWFALVVALGASGAVAPERLGPIGLGVVVGLPVALLSWAVLGTRLLAADVARIPLELLVGLNAMRVLGIFFVLLHFDGRLPAPFAPSAGWGDITVGALALPVAYLVRHRVRGWKAAVLAWNTLGIADLFTALTLGVTSSPGPLRVFLEEPGSGIMTGLPWILIPAFIVPLLIAMHMAVYARILGERAPRRLASARP